MPAMRPLAADKRAELLTLVDMFRGKYTHAEVGLNFTVHGIATIQEALLSIDLGTANVPTLRAELEKGLQAIVAGHQRLPDGVTLQPEMQQLVDRYCEVGMQLLEKVKSWPTG